VKHVTAIKALIAKLRQAVALLDAYEGDGWRGARRAAVSFRFVFETSQRSPAQPREAEAHG